MTKFQHAAVHRERWQGIKRNFSAVVTARFIAALGGLIQVPFALNHLGAEAYGFWMILVNAVVLMNVTDLGMGIGLQNRIAAHYGKCEYVQINGLIRHGARILGFTAVWIVLIIAPMVLWIDWAAILHLNDPSILPELTACLFITLAGIFFNLPLTLAGRLAAATQQSWLNPFWNCIVVLIQLVAIIVASTMKAAVSLFLIISLAGMILQHTAVLFHLLRKFPWLKEAKVLPSESTRRELRKTATKLFVPNAGATFTSSVMPTFIALFASPVLVTQFNLLQRIFNTLLQGYWMAMTPFWPAYTEAQARRDPTWVRQSFRASLLVTAAVLTMVAGIAVFHKPLLQIWLGVSAPAIEVPFLIFITVWFGSLVLISPFSSLLGGLGHGGGMALCWIITCVLYIAGTFVFGPTHHELAVVGSAALAMLFINFPGIAIEALLRYRSAMRQMSEQSGNNESA